MDIHNITDTPSSSRNLINNLYLLFTFSLPFELVSVHIGSIDITPVRILGIIILLYCIAVPKTGFTQKPRLLYIFILFLILFVLRSSFEQNEFFLISLERSFLLLQLIVLFWISYNILSQNQYLIRISIVVFSMGCLCIALIQLLGIGTEHVLDIQRKSALGRDPNIVAVFYVLGIIISFHTLIQEFIYPRILYKYLFRLLLISSISLMLYALIKTASRGAILSLIIGILLSSYYPLYIKRNFKYLIYVFIFLILIIITLKSDLFFFERLQLTYYEGDLSKREIILPIAIQIFLESPLWGWGPTSALYELGNLTMSISIYKSTHNVFIGILLSLGIIGLSIYIAAYYRLFKASLNAMRNSYVLPFVIFMTVVTIQLSLEWFWQKPLWYIFSYLLASSNISDRHTLFSTQLTKTIL